MYGVFSYFAFNHVHVNEFFFFFFSTKKSDPNIEPKYGQLIGSQKIKIKITKRKKKRLSELNSKQESEKH